MGRVARIQVPYSRTSIIEPLNNIDPIKDSKAIFTIIYTTPANEYSIVQSPISR
ncbi:hypothetical protein PFLA_b0437 [Pseudoalteromonas flavipulchra NCIMB 2033 = ATCC BAA-314]|nr:hypothetical protein [Pseudoalteromonas flavipulchra NCIMB 2033 = ATCC BAA-314]